MARDGAIDVATVSDTRRAALVNALVRGGWMVLRGHTDVDIETKWMQMRHAHPGRLEVIEVAIERMAQ